MYGVERSNILPELVDPSDPARCQFTSSAAQCNFRRIPGSEYCKEHTPNLMAIERRLYQLTEVRNRKRLAQLTQHDAVEALRDVISLAVRLIERRFNLIENDTDLLGAYYDLNNLILVVQRLKKSATIIERKLDALLSRQTVIRAGQRLVDYLRLQLKGCDGEAEIVARVTSRVEIAIERVTPASRNSQSSQSDPVLKLRDETERLRVKELRGNSQLQSLTEEIGLQIILIEGVFNSITDDLEMVKQLGKLASSFVTLEVLIKTAHEMERALGNLLSSEALSGVGREIGVILNEELSALPESDQVVENILSYLSSPEIASPDRMLAHDSPS